MLSVGARSRELTCPGAELSGVHYLRGIADVAAIREGLKPGARVVIIGGRLHRPRDSGNGAQARLRGDRAGDGGSGDEPGGGIQRLGIFRPRASDPGRQDRVQHPRRAARRNRLRGARRVRGRQHLRGRHADRRRRGGSQHRSRRGRRARVRERHRGRRPVPHRGSCDIRRRRLHQSSLAPLRHARSARIGRQRVRTGQGGRAQHAGPPDRARPGAVVLVRPIRQQAVDRRVVPGLRSAGTARRSGHPRIQRVLPEGRRADRARSRQSLQGLHGGPQDDRRTRKARLPTSLPIRKSR